MYRLEPIDGDVSGERLAFATSLDQLATEAYRGGRYKDACAQFLGALAIRQELLGVSSPEVADAFNNVGVTLRRLGQLGRARMHHERALEIRRRLQGTEHPDVASTLNNLGNVLMCQGEVDLAAEHYERALEIREEAGLADSSGAIRLFTNLELAHQLRRRYAEPPRRGPQLVRTGPTRPAPPSRARRSKAFGSRSRGSAEVSGEIARPTNAVPVSKPVRAAPVLPRPGRLAPGQAGPIPFIETQKTNQIIVTDERIVDRQPAFDPTPVVRPIVKARTEQLDLDSDLLEIVEPVKPVAAPPPVRVVEACTEQLELDSDFVEVIDDGGSARLLPAPVAADAIPATLEPIPTPAPRDLEVLGDGFFEDLDAATNDDDFIAIEDVIMPRSAPPVPWPAIAIGVATGLAVMGVLSLLF